MFIGGGIGVQMAFNHPKGEGCQNGLWWIIKVNWGKFELFPSRMWFVALWDRGSGRKFDHICQLVTLQAFILKFGINFYPFHIKPIMRSQRRFENNAVWCERSEAALFDTGVRKGAFYMGGLLLPREVFWKRILAKSRSLRRFGCQCERVHRIMRRERPNNALGWWCPSALSCSVF